MEGDCVSSYWTRDQLYFMAKVMKLPVSKNMTKAQLCVHLTMYKQTGGIKTALLKSVRKNREMRSQSIEESPMKGFLKPTGYQAIDYVDLQPKKLFGPTANPPANPTANPTENQLFGGIWV